MTVDKALRLVTLVKDDHDHGIHLSHHSHDSGGHNERGFYRSFLVGSLPLSSQSTGAVRDTSVIKGKVWSRDFREET
jgi:hypothetical protein